MGQFGQTSGGRSFGGSGSSSNWCTDTAPWRFDVPRQSDPVSPPPRITTRFPVARSWFGTRSPATTLFCCGRKSIAK
jgi:hypothetical protein